MIPSEYPESYDGLCELQGMITESDEVFAIVFDYADVRNAVL